MQEAQAKMPKGGGKGKGKGKSEKPSWMSEEVFAVSQSVPLLVDNFRGPSEKNTSPPVITKAQVGQQERRLPLRWGLLQSERWLGSRVKGIEECLPRRHHMGGNCFSTAVLHMCVAHTGLVYIVCLQFLPRVVLASGIQWLG